MDLTGGINQQFIKEAQKSRVCENIKSRYKKLILKQYNVIQKLKTMKEDPEWQKMSIALANEEIKRLSDMQKQAEKTNQCSQIGGASNYYYYYYYYRKYLKYKHKYLQLKRS